MVLFFNNISCPRESIATKQGNDEQYLFLISNVGVGAHRKRESALSHKVAKFRYFSRKFRRRRKLRVLRGTDGGWLLPFSFKSCHASVGGGMLFGQSLPKVAVVIGGRWSIE